MRAALLLGVLAGCNAIFGLDAASTPGDAPDGGTDGLRGDARSDGATPDSPTGIPCTQHDEDADGRLDCEDACPHVVDQQSTDADGDGIPDDCDPRIGGDDRLVAFHGGAAGDPSFTALPAGAWISDTDSLHFASTTDGTLQTIASFSKPMELFVRAHLALPLVPGAWRIAVSFGELECALVHGSDGMNSVLVRDDDVTNMATYSGPVDRVELTLTRHASETAACQVSAPLGGGNGPTVMIDGSNSVEGTLGLRVDPGASGTTLQFLVAYIDAPME